MPEKRIVIIVLRANTDAPLELLENPDKWYDEVSQVGPDGKTVDYRVDFERIDAIELPGASGSDR